MAYWLGCWTQDLKSRGFDPHTGQFVPHTVLLKLRQFHLPQFAPLYSAANEYQHCWECACDGLSVSTGVTGQE